MTAHLEVGSDPRVYPRCEFAASKRRSLISPAIDRQGTAAPTQQAGCKPALVRSTMRLCGVLESLQGKPSFPSLAQWSSCSRFLWRFSGQSPTPLLEAPVASALPVV